MKRCSYSGTLNARYVLRLELAGMIRGVIFDLDGTLLNSKLLRIKAWKHAFEAFGVSVTDEELFPLIGLPGPDLAGRFSPKAFEIEMEEERFFRSHLDQLVLFDDVVSTFGTLKEAGIKTAIVTSSRKAFTDMLQLPGNAIVTIDDVEYGKPDPESYLKALKLIGVRPEEAMVIGDADTDLIPAKEIGSVSVYIGHGNRRFSEYAEYYIDEVSEALRLIEKLNSQERSNQTA